MLLSQETILRDPAKLPSCDITLYSLFWDRILSYSYIDCVAAVTESCSGFQTAFKFVKSEVPSKRNSSVVYDQHLCNWIKEMMLKEIDINPVVITGELGMKWGGVEFYFLFHKLQYGSFILTTSRCYMSDNKSWDIFTTCINSCKLAKKSRSVIHLRHQSPLSYNLIESKSNSAFLLAFWES